MGRTGLTCVVAALAGGFPGPAWGASHEYHYFDEARPLDLDTARLAVLHADRDLGPAALVGIDAIDADGLPIAGWSMALVAPGRRSIDAVERLVVELAGAPAVDFVSPVFLDDLGGPLVITRDLLVQFEPRVDDATASAILMHTLAGEIVERELGGMPGAYRFRAATRNGLEILDASNRLARRDDVRFAEPDMMFTGRGALLPDDPGFDECWGLHNTGQSGGTPDIDMDIPAAWDLTTGDPAIRVVVIDTGVEQTHPDITQVAGTDLTSEGPGNGGPVNNCDDHGTAVAGCVSATINNTLGTVGSAPGCNSASARTFITLTGSCDGSWTSCSTWTVNALSWADTTGARVTCNSNIYGFSSGAIASMYDSTRSSGIVHFACAGNDGGTSIAYPGNLPTVNAVTAINRNGGLASFATTGTGLAFVAPGVDVFTTDRTGVLGYSAGDYTFIDGCSFATPYASGVAALMLSLDASSTAAIIEQTLQTTATDLGAPGYDTSFGYGLLNAFDAALPFTGPANNNCANAILAADGAFPFTTVDATTDGVDESGTCGTDAEADVWFLHFVQCPGDLTISLSGLDYDAVVHVYPDGVCPAVSGTPIACIVSPGSNQATIPVTSGVRRVRIGGVGGVEGSGTITFSCQTPPACVEDCDAGGDGSVDVADLLELLAEWGTVGPHECDFAPQPVPDGNVDIADLLALLAAWGGC